MTAGIHDTAAPVTAAALARLLPHRPHVLALGEPTHGEDILLDARNALFRQLVEHDPAWRTIALESDCLMALTVDDYVTTGTGAIDDVMSHGISHGWGTSTANRSLIEWMRTYNTGRPPAEQLRFAGIDGPLELTTGPASPRHALTALHTALAAAVPADLLPCTATTLDDLLGPDDRWTNPAAIMDPTQSIGRTPDAARLRLLCDDLAAVLDAHGPDLIAASTRDGWDRARLYARTATGLLRYHHWMADTSPARLTDLVDQRAAIMAANLLALTERGPVLVHAHNAHLQRRQSSMRLGEHRLTWWSTGAHIDAHRIGYAHVHTALGTIHHHDVGTPPADTVEGLLHTLPPTPGTDLPDAHLVDVRALTATLGDSPPRARVSPWFGYAPLDPAHLPDIDALLYIKDCPPPSQT